jgi:hypothetical protein
MAFGTRRLSGPERQPAPSAIQRTMPMLARSSWSRRTRCPRRGTALLALDARTPPSSLAPPSRDRYRGRGRACVSDPTQRND